jgi:excisionase family DNA binding protein
VSPLEAARLLSLGISRVYQLMRSGELVSYRDGRLRRITMASVHDHMTRQLAAASASGWQQWEHNPAQRRKQQQTAKAAAPPKRRAQHELPAE